MKELARSELEIMMIIWEFKREVTRAEIEERLISQGRNLNKASIFTYLNRLQEKGFVTMVKEGKNNIYTEKITEEEYTQRKSKWILKNMFHNSLKNFICALYDDKTITKEERKDLQKYIDRKK